MSKRSLASQFRQSLDETILSILEVEKEHIGVNNRNKFDRLMQRFDDSEFSLKNTIRDLLL